MVRTLEALREGAEQRAWRLEHLFAALDQPAGDGRIREPKAELARKVETAAGAAAVGRDGVLRDEASGRALPGHLSLLLFLARRIRVAGFHMRRDEALARPTDAGLFAFLDCVSLAAPSAERAAAVAA